ncbi:P2X purinoceptor 7-like [Crassostrea virginica]
MDESLRSDEFPDFVVQPYQFEPLRNNEYAQQIVNNESSSEEIKEEESTNQSSLPTDTKWCKCGNCIIMETTRECKCCVDIPEVSSRLKENESSSICCIIQHPSFKVNCLNQHVLEVSYYEYIQDNGPLGNDEPIHELYRHLAYRRFARFIWKCLGRHNRRILPSCVVTAVRQKFPSQQYCGFRYPGEPR